MSQALIDNIARAVLYEGYALYPYRPSLKNRQRWNFGSVFPRAYCELHDGERSMIQTECLVDGGNDTGVQAVVRFLHVGSRTADADAWQDVAERQVSSGDVRLDELLAGPRLQPFTLPQDDALALDRPDRQPLSGAIELSATQCEQHLFKLTVRVLNLTSLHHAATIERNAALLRSLVSAHVILNARHGKFVSMIDPPLRWRHFADECTNIGLWPVLVGQRPETDTLLCAPIILYDYPQIAPESPGDLFDSTEIDEVLTLRIQTLTTTEKQAMAAMDARTRALLERTQSIPAEQLGRLHGAMRGVPVSAPSATEVGDEAARCIADARRLLRVRVGGTYVAAGDRVRLCPRRSADAFDFLLKGKTATIAAIEQDYEDQVHLAVTIDDDPGADIGKAGKIAHRFFFRPDEVEPLCAGGEGGNQ